MRHGHAHCIEYSRRAVLPRRPVTNAMNSRNKGKRAERQLAAALRDLGYRNCRRGQQYSGASGSADVVGLPGIHVECKWVERLNIRSAMEQAVSDADSGALPGVFHRASNAPWLVTMRLDDWIEIYREWEAGWTSGETSGNCRGFCPGASVTGLR